MLLHSYASPLGEIVLAGEGETLTGLWFRGQAHFTAPAAPVGDAPCFRAAALWLDRYFAGETPGPTPLLRPEGSAFQQTVWAKLLEIPYGQTRSYGDLAAELGSSARAVGGAVARNPISLLIPCHRVLGAGGRLTGYAGGLDRKRQLLSLEAAGAGSR